MSEWQMRKLGELVDSAGGVIRTGPFGSQLHADEYTDDPSGVPVVMPKDMQDGRISRDSVSRVSETTARRLHAHRLAAGDLVLARRGDVGRLAAVASDEAGWICGTGSMRIHAPDHDVLDSQFLRYAMSAPGVGDWLVGQAVGATMPNLNAKIVSAVPIAVPGLSTQRRIAAVLSALDDLIEINRQRIELLEDLARSLYREWFVHFRFPGRKDRELIDSDLGFVPEGWTVRTLSSVATLHRKSIRPADAPYELFEHFSLPAFDAGQMPESEPGEAIKSSKYRVEEPAVLLAKINPRIPRVWFVKPNTDKAVASTEFLVWTGVEVSNVWLWSLFSDPSFRDILVGSASGTSTSHQRFKPADVQQYRVALDPGPMRAAYDASALSMMTHAARIRDQNRVLAVARDLLLPRLVSGQLDISDIDLGVLVPPEAE